MELEEEKKVVADPSSAVDALLSDEPIQEPTSQDPLKVETPEVKPQEPVVATEKTETITEKPAEPVVEKQAEVIQDKKYAGKYTNTFDLIEGVLEEVKVLKGDKKEIASLVTEAQASGNWEKVEAKYKELQSQVVKQIQDNKKPAEVKSPTEPQKPSEPIETDMPKAEFDALILDTTMKQISDSALSKKFEKFGAEIPTTQEALDELEVSHPTLWTQFTDTFKNLYSANDRQARAFLQAEKEAPQHNDSQKQKTIQQIGDFVKEWGVDLSEEKIQSILSEAEKSNAVFEDKYGVKFIREEAMFEYFMAKHAREILSQVKAKTNVAALNQGAINAMQDIEAAKKKVPQTMSTSSIPPSVAQKSKEIDWSNPDDAKKAGADAVRGKIDELLYS